MQVRLSIHAILGPLLVPSLLCIALSLSAQECLCPILDEVRITGGNCDLINTGSCIGCVSDPLILEIRKARHLPPGGNIRWFMDTVPGFNPNAGEGHLILSTPIPDPPCITQGQVRINEFQPWPLLGDNDNSGQGTGEWIELAGPPGTDIGCHILTDADWTITIPPGTVIPANGLYVIGYSQFGPVDLSLDTCNCAIAGLPGEVLNLENQGEYLLLWNGSSYIDAVLYGNPGLSNTPPFGTLVTLGVIPTVGLGGCATQLPLTFPAFSQINTLPQQNHTYARMPDQSGSWKLENCGTKGRCNVVKDPGLPYTLAYDIPDSLCGKTLYFKVLIDELPGMCPSGPNHSLAGPLAISVNCPRSEFTATLCPLDSLVFNGNVYNRNKPQGLETFQSADNCDSLVMVNLIFLPEATVTFAADSVICLGDSIDLSPIFIGTGPFFMNLLADGLPTPLFNGNSGQNSLWVSPKDTTLYTLGFFQDGNGCPGKLDAEVRIGVNAPLATLTTIPEELCLGDTSIATFQFQGGAPFQIAWRLGNDTIVETVGMSRTLSLTPSVDIALELLGATDHRGCNASLPPAKTIRVYEPPTLTDVDLTCLPDKSGFTVGLSLSGGLASGYQVTGLPGSFTGSTWTSDVQSNGTSFQVLYSDGGPCPVDTVAGILDCQCTNEAGVLSSTDTLRVCPGDSTQITFLVPPVLNTGDSLVYVLTTNPAYPQNGIIAISSTGKFPKPATPPILPSIWVCAVVNSSGFGTLSPSDPCMRISACQPVVFLEQPSLSISPPASLCGNECLEVDVFITGKEPTRLTWRWGDPSIGLASDQSSSPGSDHRIDLCGENTGTPHLLIVDSIGDQYCMIAISDSFLVSNSKNVELFYKDPLCTGDTLWLHGVSFTAVNPKGDLLLPRIQPGDCDTIVAVDLEVRLPATKDIAQLACPGFTLQVGSTLFDEANPKGQVILESAALNGCDSVVLVDLSYSTFVEFLLNDTLCQGDTLTLHGQRFHSGAAAGKVTLTGASSLGCDSVIVVDLQFHPLLALELSGDTAVCFGDSVQLSIQGTPGFYDLTLQAPGGSALALNTFQPGDKLPFLSSTSGTFIPLSAIHQSIPCPVSFIGKLALEVQRIDAEIEVLSDFSGRPISCQGAQDGSLEVVVGGSPGTGWQYFWGDGLTGAIREDLGAGLYEVTVSNALGCTDTSSVLFEEPLPLRLLAEASSDPCKDGSIRVLGVVNGIPPLRVRLDGGIWTPIPSSGPSSSFPAGPGQHVLALEDRNGCTTDTILTIEQLSNGNIVTAFPDTTVFIGQRVQLGFLSDLPAVFSQWLPPQGLDCTNCFDPIASVEENMVYTVSVKDTSGCITSASVTIKALDEADLIYRPNAFSPNQDGINDRFLPFADDAIFRIEQGRIFDRWGNLIWQCQDVSPSATELGWDGSSPSGIMQPGVYVYVFQIRNLVTGKARTFEGEILLAR